VIKIIPHIQRFKFIVFQKLQYKNTLIHRVVPDFVIQMGDVSRNNGMGGKMFTQSD